MTANERTVGHFGGLFALGALAASLANRSALSRSRFLRWAICSFSYSVSGLSDARNMLLLSFPRLLMNMTFRKVLARMALIPPAASPY